MRFSLTMLLLMTAMTVCAQAPHKNLKVLKEDQVRPVMGAMTASLGQRCGYCHVQGDNASDANPKKVIARHMMELVNDINAKFPDGKVHVSCYTCHRGKTEPDMAPPAAQ
jgi:hypothetical protein